MECDEGGDERWVQAAREAAGLAAYAVAVALRERGAEDVVRAAVPAQVDRTASSRHPRREGGDADEQAEEEAPATECGGDARLQRHPAGSGSPAASGAGASSPTRA